MGGKDKYLFQLLKKEIVAKMRLSYPGISEDIAQWKGQDITDFQDELARTVKEQVSEKWFYIHMKADNDTLPRIDVLNFLSRFAGYRGWDDFRHSKRNDTSTKNIISKPSRYFIFLPLLTIVILVAFYFAYKGYSTREYTFCFFDSDSGERIENSHIEVNLLQDGEFSQSLLCNAEGCLSITTDMSSLTMKVRAPYYHTKTLTRNLKRSERDEEVMLRPNSYAMMIHHFSKSSMEERLQNRDQLEEMISDEAIIYFASDLDTSEVEMCTKGEFIDMLTGAAADPFHIEVLETKFRFGKISILRFRLVKGQN
jgi:hypothetical protein